MKITRKILERLIKQEVKGLLIEQGTDPVTGQPVTIGGQDGKLGRIRVGQSSKLAANYSSNRPTEEQFANEPVATYVMQRLDAMMVKLDNRIGDLEALMGDQEDPSDAIADQVDSVQERLKRIVKEEVSKTINEQGFEGLEGLPTNKVFTTEEAIPILIRELEKLKTRLSQLERKLG